MAWHYRDSARRWGFVLWSALAPLDAGVVADGAVTVSSNRKTIQHLSGGRVTDIFIGEGEAVKKIRSYYA
ncbi:hypothetical protein PCI56_01615 [Plesiomonas shigelloides subsp. oncorhynchi]|nr:hypothetical protein [Plesiomonas shigelloides]